MIYTDSKYAYRVVHTIGKIWVERRFINSKEKSVTHESLIKEVLEALRGLLEIAIVHIRGHLKGNLKEIEGNNLADQEAKRAALEGDEGKVLYITSEDDRDEGEEVPVLREKEQEEIQKHGAVKDDAGKWKMGDKF